MPPRPPDRASGERPRRCWSGAGYWSLAAVLFLLPDNRTPTSVSSAITGMSPGEPSAYSHFLNSFGNHFGSGGVGTDLAAGHRLADRRLRAPVVRRPTPFLAAGGLLATFFWVSGQGLGGIFTGSGTDPNTGPLIVLLALAMVPAVLPDPAHGAPRSRRCSFGIPCLVLGGVVALVVGLVPRRRLPGGGPGVDQHGHVRHDRHVGAIDVGFQRGRRRHTATCTRGNNGAPRTGLDVTNTPNMVMAGPGTGMNMNGADASAAAGLNTTKANWHYTGPALPTAEAQELLAQGANGPTDIHMAEPTAARPSPRSPSRSTPSSTCRPRARRWRATPPPPPHGGRVPAGLTDELSGRRTT